MKRHEQITKQTLEALKFKSVDGSDLLFSSPGLDVVRLQLLFFNDSYHFVLKDHTYQGIGTMSTVSELVDGLNFVTNNRYLESL